MRDSGQGQQVRMISSYMPSLASLSSSSLLLLIAHFTTPSHAAPVDDLPASQHIAGRAEPVAPPPLRWDLEVPFPISIGAVAGAYGGSLLLVGVLLLFLSRSRRRKLEAGEDEVVALQQQADAFSKAHEAGISG